MLRNVFILSAAAVLVMAAISLIYQDSVARHLGNEFTNTTTNDNRSNVTTREVTSIKPSEPSIHLTQESYETNIYDNSDIPVETPAPEFTTESTEDELCCEDELEFQGEDSTERLSWAEKRTQGLIEQHGDIPEVHTFVSLYLKMKRREKFTPQEYLELLRVTEIVQPYSGNAGAYERFKAFIKENGEENMSMMYQEHDEPIHLEKEELVWDE